MKRVIIESPYKGDVARNKLYLQACIRDSLSRGESPYASHQMLTSALDDAKADERAHGMLAGVVWYECAELVAVYTDFGISSGMDHGVVHARALKKPIEHRSLGGIWFTWGSLVVK